MPRQGRQPKQLAGASTQRKQRPSQPAQQPKKGGKGKSATSRHTNDDDEEPSTLDVYAYKARVKRPRGDVDPEARATMKSGKKQQQAKGKGKGRAPAQDDDEELDNDEEEDEDLSDEEEGFRIRGDEPIEWTGRKPAGFKLGMDSDEEGGKFVGFDEDIDSDLASGSEDDLPQASTSKKGKKGKKVVESTAIDLDENEIDWDDEDGAGYMDLTELLDAGGYPSGSDDGESELGSGSGDEDEEDEEMSDEDESDITSDDEGALDKLDSFVDGLDSKKRKSRDDEDDAGGKKKKRVVLKERTEALPEGEFAAVNADEGKVNLDDLLSSFSDSKNPRLASLRKSLKPLSGSSSSSADKLTTTNSHLKSSGALAAPLPGRLQDKIDREAAYEKTKEETDKWNETVRRMKGESGLGVEGARHERLTLPLMGGAGDVRRDPNAAEWSAKFQATNELEASIQNLLAAGQMSQSDLQKREQQELAKLDPVELAARQAELRRQRDLMYRAERKAKRVAKIKSKAYRRIHRKAKEKNGENGPQLSLEDLAELDAIDGGNRVEEERSRLEIMRAKERATLKHSSKGGRWAQKIDGLEGLEEERNASIRDMVARREELRRKIAGVGSDEEVDEFASSGSDEGMGGSDDDEGDFDSVRRKAFDELASLDAKEAAAKANDPKLKGVMNMKFMRDAMARADREVQKDADELRDRLARMDEMAEGGESGDEEEGGPTAMSEQVQGNLGRMVFGPSGGAQSAAPQPDTSASAPKSATTTKLSSVSIASPLVASATASSSRPTPRSRPSLRDPSASADADTSNPWLTLADDEPSSSTPSGGAKLSRKLNKASFGKDSASAADKSANRAARARGKQADAREADREDAKVEIDVSGEAALSSAAAAAGGKKAKGKAKALPVQVGGAMVARPDEGLSGAGRANDEEEDESEGEMDEEEIDAQRGRGPAAFKQRELVKEAFANDDVVADFAEAKRKEIERDAPREEDNTLPGWGAWGGKGAKKQKNPRKFVTKIAGVDVDKRKDAGLNHVIISEKKDRKAAKYMLKDLPFPYTSAAQHEHKLRTPMGPEWSTSTILRDQTMPSVLVKPGVSIRPVDKKVQ
ncbi:hypothetical protein JCM11251_005854 [Rhodosporidiobolus azoricus]